MLMVNMGACGKVDEMDEGGEKWVMMSGIHELRLLPMKPVLTKPRWEEDEDHNQDEDEQAGYSCSTTPTFAESRIPSRLACPPPPKKRKSAASRRHYGRVTEFFRPPDLETIFIRRLEGT